MTGSPVLQGNLPALVLLLASHPCAKCPETKSSTLAPKRPRRQHCRTQTSLEWSLALIPGLVASHHGTCKPNIQPETAVSLIPQRIYFPLISSSGDMEKGVEVLVVESPGLVSPDCRHRCPWIENFVGSPGSVGKAGG